jgi:hypothetical protein
MRSPQDSIHWTEIYVIITVSAAIIEEIRKVSIDYFNMRVSMMSAEYLARCRISYTNVRTMASSRPMDVGYLYLTLHSVLHRHRTSLWLKESS